MSEVLRRYGNLEQRISDLYKQFATNPDNEPALSIFWRDVASQEEQHVQVLTAEQALLAALSDPGRFLPEFSAQFTNMNTLLHQFESKTRTGIKREEAFAFMLQLEQEETGIIERHLLPGRRLAYTFFAPSLEDALALAAHQQVLLEGGRCFLAQGRLLDQLEAWVTQQQMQQRKVWK